MTETQKHQERYAFLRDRISCGWFHIAGVLDDGTVKACGNNEAQQCEVTDWTDIVKIKCGPLRTVGLRKDGTVLSTKGDVFTGDRIPGEGIEKFTDVVDIACGTFHTVGLRRDGTVIACGFNDDGQCNVEGWKNVKNIYAANNHTIALCNDGTLLYCGGRDGGALHFNGIPSVKKLYCGLNDTVLVAVDGKVYRTDFESETPILIDVMGDEIAHIEFNVDHFIILKTNGTVLHFGSKDDGRGEVSEWSGILDVICSDKVCAGLTKEAVYMTGTNGARVLDLKGVALQLDANNISGFVAKSGKVSAFQKGNGEECGSFILFESLPTSESNVGEKMEAAKEIEKKNEPHKSGMAWEHKQKYGYLINRLAGGIGHSVGVIYDGTVEACGGNGFGQCDVDYWSDVTAVACTAGATLGLRKDGTVLYTGKIPFNTDNCSAYGTHPSKWTNVKAIAGCLHSTDHAVGLLADGKVVAFGCNEDGQCNVTNWCDIIEISVQPALTAGVRKDGTVVVCGKDAAIKNIVAKWTNIEHLYKGVGEQSLIGLKYDGTVVSTENDKTFDMSNWRGIIDISVGMTCIAGLTGNGHLYFTGKVPQDMLVEGINGVLCVNAEQDAILAAKNDHTTDMIVMNKGVANKTNVNGGSLGFQTGMAHKMIIQECGEVLTQILFEQMDCGQDDTDDWAMTKPVDAPNGGSAPTNGGGGNAPVQNAKGGCYVATCVYGSYDCPQVWTLRRYRDDTLGSTWYGRLFIRTYYAISPVLVKWFGNTNWFKKLWKGRLDRMVAKLQENGIEDTPYEDKNW